MAASQSYPQKLAHSEHAYEAYRYQGQMGQSAYYQGQPQMYYAQNGYYMPQQPQPQPYQR